MLICLYTVIILVSKKSTFLAEKQILYIHTGGSLRALGFCGAGNKNE